MGRPTVVDLVRWIGIFLVFETMGCSPYHPQKKDTPSGALVTDGAEISSSEFPSVVRLDLGDALCTGTFMSPTTLMTAAHCLQGRNVVFFNRIGSTRLIQNPSYGKDDIANDIAIAIFPPGTAPNQTNLLGRPPRPGEPATIVGYGNSFYRTPFDENGFGSGVRRKGQNSVRANNGEVITLTAIASRDARAICGGGDSGGPLFIDDKLAGVTSSRTLSTNPPSCLYVDLSGRRSRDFLQKAVLQGADIPGISSPSQNEKGRDPEVKSSPQPPGFSPQPPIPSPSPLPAPLGRTPPPSTGFDFGWSVQPSVSLKGCYCTRDLSGKFCAVFKDNNSRAWTRLDGPDCESDCRTYLKYDLKSCELE